MDPSEIYVTGFGPFGKHDENPSGELAASLGSPHQVLPVTFDAIDEFLSEAPFLDSKALMMIGLAGKAEDLLIETTAHNRIGATADVSGEVRGPAQIESFGPPQLSATLWQSSQVHAPGRDWVMSVDAGDYLCGYSLYRSLSLHAGFPIGFLHIPSTKHIPMARQAEIVKSLVAMDDQRTHQNGHQVDDVRIEEIRPLIAPAILIEDIPCTAAASDLVWDTRKAIVASHSGEDDRLVGIVGPCSIHDIDAAREYGTKLKALADQHKNELILVMRTYFEKPRTVGGWKGLMNDPDLDGSYQINRGLKLSRQLLADLAADGIPVATEFLDSILPQYITDHVAWAAIGARTTESQIHRQFASGCSMPVGFKNSTSGDTQTAIDAVRTAGMSHWFSSVTKQGISAILKTSGNRACHVILRGGADTGPNFEKQFVEAAAENLESLGLPPRVMVDCSHGNSGKDFARQKDVVQSISNQLVEGSDSIFGFMLESFLVEGRQNFSADGMTYGQSITDSCVSIEETEGLLNQLAEAVKARRSARS